MNDLIDRLRDFDLAYPESVFPPFTPEETKEHSVLITRASGAMGRHLAQFMVEAADEIQRLRDSLSEAVRVPGGWKLVPLEPSTEQIAAMHEHVEANRATNDVFYHNIYRAMVAAAPEAPK